MRDIIREIKQNKWWFFYAAIVCLYLIIKMYRDIYVSSDSQGGIWNYIQLFFVLLGLFYFATKFTSEASSYGKRVINYLIIFSFWSLFIAFASVLSINIKTMYGLGMIPYGAMILLTSFIMGNRVVIDTKAFNWLYIVTFLILCVVFFTGRQQEIITEYFEGAGMVASVYYILCFFPLLIAIKPKWSLFIIFLVGVCLLISNKRAGTLALGVCLMYYFIFNKQRGRIKSILIMVAAGIILYFSMNYIVGHFGVDVMGRMENLEESGGSGRLRRWSFVMNEIDNSSFFELLFGHGDGATYRILGGEVHNDFISVVFEYGLVSLFFYVFYFVGTFRMWLKMRRDNYRYEHSVFMLNVITLFLALFSFYIIRPTYITASMFSYGLFIADWYRQKNQIGIC